MNEQAATNLQAEIDSALARTSACGFERITLDHGSEVTDLTMIADVRCLHRASSRERLFSIVTTDFLEWIFSLDSWRGRPEIAEVYTRGGPLAVVRRITGESVLGAVMRYVELEAHRAGL